MHTANIIYIERQFRHTCNNPQYSGVKVQGGTLHKFTSSCLESNTVSRSFDVQRRYLKCYTKFQFNGFCFALQGGVNIPHIHVASPLRPKLLETVAI